MNVKDQAAIVTGGASGLGGATASALADGVGLGAGGRRLGLGDGRAIFLGAGLQGRRDVGGGTV